MTITMAFIHWSSDTGGVKCKFYCDSKNKREKSSNKMLHPVRLGLGILGLQYDALLTELTWYMQVSLKVSDLQAMLPDQVSLEATLCCWNFCWLVRVSLFIELGCPGDLGKGWRGHLGTFMISRPI